MPLERCEDIPKADLEQYHSDTRLTLSNILRLTSTPAESEEAAAESDSARSDQAVLGVTPLDKDGGWKRNILYRPRPKRARRRATSAGSDGPSPSLTWGARLAACRLVGHHAGFPQALPENLSRTTTGPARADPKSEQGPVASSAGRRVTWAVDIPVPKGSEEEGAMQEGASRADESVKLNLVDLIPDPNASQSQVMIANPPIDVLLEDAPCQCVASGKCCNRDQVAGSRFCGMCTAISCSCSCADCDPSSSSLDMSEEVCFMSHGS
jgi:hypothetical protein